MTQFELKTLGPTEAGRVLGVSRNVVYRLIHEGTIPALQLGRKLRVPVAALEEMLRNPKPLNQQEASKQRRADVEASAGRRQRAEGHGAAH